MCNREGKMARRMLHFAFMRSILALFVMAALGFAIILKKDAPQPVTTNKQFGEHSQVSKRNSGKHGLERGRTVATRTISEQQQNELP
jgi:hypothetical protein